MNKRLILLMITLLGLVLAACAEDAEDADPADAVEKYLKAMVEKNEDDFDSVICEDFQSAAMTDFRSFGAVEASLKDMKCSASDKSDDSAKVTCTGSIEVVYQGENSDALPLEGTTYLMTNDDDEWKVCGKE